MRFFRIELSLRQWDDNGNLFHPVRIVNADQVLRYHEANLVKSCREATTEELAEERKWYE